MSEGYVPAGYTAEQWEAVADSARELHFELVATLAAAIHEENSVKILELAEVIERLITDADPEIQTVLYKDAILLAAELTVRTLGPEAERTINERG